MYINMWELIDRLYERAQELIDKTSHDDAVHYTNNYTGRILGFLGNELSEEGERRLKEEEPASRKKRPRLRRKRRLGRGSGRRAGTGSGVNHHRAARSSAAAVKG